MENLTSYTKRVADSGGFEFAQVNIRVADLGRTEIAAAIVPPPADFGFLLADVLADIAHGGSIAAV